MNLMASKKVLLTGGRGMVGRNVLEHPDAGRWNIVAPTSRQLDLTDFSATLDFLQLHRPDYVIHAAGKVGGIHANVREPVSFLLDNLDMGMNIVRASSQVGVRRLINLGSSCMYPRNQGEPLRENMVLTGELEPTNEGYALAKVITARLCDYLRREDASCQYKTLIPCNIYGRYDKFDPARSHLVPAIIHKIHEAQVNGRDTVEIWGDGLARREFMYAGDLADAILLAVEKFDSLPSYMNVGLGHDYTIDEYYQAAAEVMGYTGRFLHNLHKPVGMDRKLVSIERQMSWGWSARSDLRNGLDETYKYFLEKATNEL